MFYAAVLISPEYLDSFVFLFVSHSYIYSTHSNHPFKCCQFSLPSLQSVIVKNLLYSRNLSLAEEKKHKNIQRLRIKKI